MLAGLAHEPHSYFSESIETVQKRALRHLSGAPMRRDPAYHRSTYVKPKEGAAM